MNSYCVLVCRSLTNFPEEPAASIFRVENMPDTGKGYKEREDLDWEGEAVLSLW
jgi:hypothetical protein